MQGTRAKPIYALLAGALLGLIVMPIAFAGASSSPTATASASVKKKLKKLNQKVNALQAEQGQPRPPFGNAGGDLTGNFPNPLVGANAVEAPEIADNSVGSSELGGASVGADELKGSTAVVGGGVIVTAGTPKNTNVTCPGGTKVIGGGFAWSDDEPNSVIASAPSEADPSHTWEVRGIVDAGENHLFAWANCVAV